MESLVYATANLVVGSERSSCRKATEVFLSNMRQIKPPDSAVIDDRDLFLVTLNARYKSFNSILSLSSSRNSERTPGEDCIELARRNLHDNLFGEVGESISGSAPYRLEFIRDLAVNLSAVTAIGVNRHLFLNLEEVDAASQINYGFYYDGGGKREYRSGNDNQSTVNKMLTKMYDMLSLMNRQEFRRFVSEVIGAEIDEDVYFWEQQIYGKTGRIESTFLRMAGLQVQKLNSKRKFKRG